MSDPHDSQLRTSGNPLLEGKGVTDPHVRIFNDRAYMYATHDRGPDCQGSIILEENVHPSLRYSHKPLTFDRHGSFFQWRGQWYFICNDMSRTGKTHFRDSSICYVEYRDNGQIEPVKIDPQGVAAVT